MPGQGALDHVGAFVRQRDPDRYYAALLTSGDKRSALLALYAFSAEIARVRDQVTNPMPGEIRLQWWRDALSGEARGDAAANPIAAALEDAVTRFCLPRAALFDLVDARVFDLYDDPMPTTPQLEGYLGETVAAIVRLASIVLAGGEDPGHADAAGHAGLAIGFTGLLRALPWHARAGQLFVPADLLAAHGVTRDDVVLGRGGPGFVAVLAEMRAMARDHLGRARALVSGMPAAQRPAFAQLALAAIYLDRMERPSYDPFQTVIDLPAWRKIGRLWWAARRKI